MKSTIRVSGHYGVWERRNVRHDAGRWVLGGIRCAFKVFAMVVRPTQ